jgi:hypothetical protein
MKHYGRTSVHEFLSDFVVYRNLVPADPRLPPLSELRSEVGLPEGVIPRKSEPEYARFRLRSTMQPSNLKFLQNPLYCDVVQNSNRRDGVASQARSCARSFSSPGIGSEFDLMAFLQKFGQKNMLRHA